jgi:predicted ATP-dependent endonuclease of OLD family
MKIKRIAVKNFRLLKNVSLDARDELSLLIGKNNSGKTSFISLFDKFLKKDLNFYFDDFNLDLRKNILSINEETDEHSLSIKLILEIDYSNAKTLENISNFFLDLGSDKKIANILFECYIDKIKLLKKLKLITGKDKESRKASFIKKNLSDYLIIEYYSFLDEDDIEGGNRVKLVRKKREEIDKIINFQVIHAKRDVHSSESSGSSRHPLSSLTTSYFDTRNDLSQDERDEINLELLKKDKEFEVIYEKFFSDFLDNSQLLGLGNLRVISDLESRGIIAHHSRVVYGDDDNCLPEYLNGLGHLNILYLLLQIKIKKEYFNKNSKDINIFFIEEPEAHTHPQIQSIFIKHIKEILGDKLQVFITTHSPYIVKDSDFEDVRYFANKNGEVRIKNFYDELYKKYKEEKEENLFEFLKQYLTINSAELFFAEKVIFIEGVSERILLPYFMKRIDPELLSKNISVLEVGANAKAFRHFIDFFGIKTLIITDIDTVKKKVDKKEKVTYTSCPVLNGETTSNATLKYFLDYPSNVTDVDAWFEKLKKGNLKISNSDLKITYQTLESDYHGRSFEESFISLNLKEIYENKEELEGLKNIKNITKDLKEITVDELVKDILDKKSSFASSLLYLALIKNIEWKIPNYIKNGLLWLKK